MNDSLDHVLERFRNVKRSGEGHSALCPGHDDHQSSLSIGIGDDGRILLKCFAGCSVESIVQAIDLRLQDLYPGKRDYTTQATPERALTVAALASNKLVSVEFLRSLGLEDRPAGVAVPYFELDGSQASRIRLRTSIVAKEGSVWLSGRGKPVPYGLQRLDDARRADFLILVEGESDCWTLWHNGFPAIGIPGATMYSKLRAEHVEGISRIYVVQEPDSAGVAFVDGVAGRLAKLQWKGQAFVAPMAEVKDPSDLYRSDPTNFKETFQKTLDAAEILTLPKASQKTSVARSNDAITGILSAAGVLQLTSRSSPSEIESALRALGTSIAGVDNLKRAVVQQTAEAHLSGAGVRGVKHLIGAALKTARPDKTNGLFLEDPEPTDDEFDPCEMVEQLIGTLNRYVSLPKYGDVAVALWVLHCYVFGAMEVSPILCIRSPLKRCGKTTLLEVIGAMVPRALMASNITPAALFRSIEKYRPALLVDEADTFLTTNDELRGVINAGHYRSTANVIRSVGEDHDAKVFSTWCPKVISLIGKLQATLEDRSIVISMRRRAPGEHLERLRRDRIQGRLRHLRGQMARWAMDHLDEVRELDPECPESLDDRAQDNWRPLLAIAEVLGPRWSKMGAAAALAISTSSSETENTAAVQLLEDLQKIFRERGTDFLPSEVVVGQLTAMEERPWGEWKLGQPLTKIQLSRLMRGFEVSPAQQRNGGAKQRGYRLSDLQDCFARYLGPDSGRRDTPSDCNDLENNASRDTVGTVPSRVGTDAQQESRCPDSESGRPDSVPTQDLFESGQPHDPTDRDRDGFDL